MNFLKKLLGSFSGSAQTDRDAYWIAVRCNRCGEVIRARVDLRNDLSAEYEQGGGMSYFCRKVLMGQGNCFQRVEVELIFSSDYTLVNREITGGQYVEE
jgi:hypothetical protein